MNCDLDLRLQINPEDERTFGPCACCGNMTRRIWGYVEQVESTIAAYFVEWTKGHSERDANFDLIVGRWGGETTSQDRSGIALDFRQLPSGPAFRIIDAADRPIASSPLIRAALSRDLVIGAPIAETVFVICDAIFLKDHRLGPLRE